MHTSIYHQKSASHVGVHIYQHHGSHMSMAISGTDSLEVPTIYKAYLSGFNFREYPHKIWPEIWYSTSNLGSWISYWFIGMLMINYHWNSHILWFIAYHHSHWISYWYGLVDDMLDMARMARSPTCSNRLVSRCRGTSATLCSRVSIGCGNRTQGFPGSTK